MTGRETEIYEFGGFRLNVTERFLVRFDSGERIPLREKAFEILCILVRNAGHLVPKNELLDQVWSESFVEENNLNKCILAVRRALGESRGQQQFIETVKKHGFRFVSEVRRIGLEEKATANSKNGFQTKTKPNSATEFPSPVEQGIGQKSGVVVALADWRHEAVEKEVMEPGSLPITPAEYTEQTNGLEQIPAKPDGWSQRVAKYRRPLIAFTIVLVGTAALVYYFYISKGVPAGAVGQKSIAVLPVKPINTANRDELYEIGIADTMINRLSSMKGITVRQLNAIRQYTDLAQDPLAAGREQRVDYVLASSYQYAGGKIRLTAQLLNVASGQIEGAYKIEKDANDFFAMQDAVADEVAKFVMARFSTTSTGPAAKHGTINEEAYRLYLQGKILTAKQNEASVQKSIEYFEQAVRLDPNYALAYTGMAHAYSISGTLGGGLRIQHEVYQKGRAAIDKALLLDADLANSYAVRGEIKLKEWDFTGAENDLRRAIELEPNNDLAHGAYALLLNYHGRFDEALSELETALEIDPNSLAYRRDRGRILYFARRYDEAIVHLERIFEVDNNFSTVFHWLTRAYEKKGDYDGAFKWHIEEQKRRNPERINDYQKAYETGGWEVFRRKILEFEKLDKRGNFYRYARQHAILNDKELAFEYLNKAFEERETEMIMLKVEPAFDSLREDPRFDELLRHVGFK